MPNLFFYSIIFIFGLMVGSFLNCVIYRLEISEEGGGMGKKALSFLRGRSYCPNCKHTLSWQDLIPIFSFLALKGKCRYCHQKISCQYPLVEFLTGFLFVFIFWHLGFNFDLVFACPVANLFCFGGIWILGFIYLFLVSCFLIVIFVYDLKRYIIPDIVIYPAIVLALIYQLFRIFDFRFFLDFGFWHLDFKNLANPLSAAILAASFFFIIVFISRGKWMGVGDIKLAFLMGLFLGWPNVLVALFSAFFIGAIIGIILMIFGKKTLKSEVPFGPFLVAGTFIALFCGQNIANWYSNILK